MADNPARPRSRWFRFSLRTMLILMAVLGAWLAYQLNWIKERDGFARYAFVVKEFGSAPAPLSLRLFGARGIRYVVVGAETTAEEELLARRMFPEAEIMREGSP